MNKMYIVAKYIQTLRDPKTAHLPGIGKRSGAWQNDEVVKCVRNLKTKEEVEASVILDVANERVIKNRFNDNNNFEQLYAYYLSHYADYINSWVNAQRSR